MYGAPPAAVKRSTKLEPGTAVIDGATVRAFVAGEATAPSAVDGCKKGMKRTLMDGHGVPLTAYATGANASDQKQFIPCCRASVAAVGNPGRPKERSDEVYADRGATAQRRAADQASYHLADGAARLRARDGNIGVGADDQSAEGRAPAPCAYDRLGVIQNAWRR